ncbi:isochorismatase family protein [Geomicrobium sp. JCM 19038]|uniref:isochorismatase family protein n=1 Tax=Geomicrobium sp. JCM 19038 TaxID=1460635 RepID=UPI00045F1557|nr:isochorismatase family protein [Geomicrobium sp. JCM 19038]GAK08504.1 isochorismatase [Geomicrobium sp. JCM 19038]
MIGNNVALVLVDFQKAFEEPSWGEFSTPKAVFKASELLHYFRDQGGLVIHIQHTRTDPVSLFYKGSLTHSFMEPVLPVEDEMIIQKDVNSSFIGTNLESVLKEHGVLEVIIAGFTTQHCVSTTVRMSGNLGFKTTLVSDATSASAIAPYDAQTIHEVTLATLRDEFADIVTTEELLLRYR